MGRPRFNRLIFNASANCSSGRGAVLSQAALYSIRTAASWETETMIHKFVQERCVQCNLPVDDLERVGWECHGSADSVTKADDPPPPLNTPNDLRRAETFDPKQVSNVPPNSVNKPLLILVAIVSLILVALSRRANVHQGKWLDYGSGILNLASVNSIKSDSSQFRQHSLRLGPAPTEIEFDNFTLQLNREITPEKAMGAIRTFLASDDSYFRLPDEFLDRRDK